MTALIYFVLGLLFTFILLRFSPQWDEFRERFSRFLSTILRKKDKPVNVGTVSLPGMDKAKIKPIRIGDMQLPIKRFVGGDGRTKYTYPDGIICEWDPDKLVLPQEIQDAYSRFLGKRRKQAEEREAVFVQREHVRLDDYKFGLLGLEDTPWPLTLFVSTTDFHTIQVTNYCIEEILPKGATIRQKYASDPGDLKNSVLANPLAVNLSVVTADQRIYVGIRGKKTATTPAGFAPAVSGTGNPRSDCNEEGIYSPFLTAQRETAEEITAHPPDLQEITFFGLARTLRFQLPFLFGEVRLSDMDSVKLESSFPRDSWETEALLAMALEIDAIIGFIREVYREMEEKDIKGSATYTAIFSLIESLHYQYPDEWQNIVRELCTLEKR